MTDDDRKRAAQTILEFPLLMEIFHDIEQTAINATLYAKSEDHEARLAHATEAKAIRNLLSRLRSIADGQTDAASRRAPA
jgi:hypothetical protein